MYEEIIHLQKRPTEKFGKSWISLVAHWTEEPILFEDKSEYQIWKYTYWNTNLYRVVYKNYDPNKDIFYSEASLENVVASRALNF